MQQFLIFKCFLRKNQGFFKLFYKKPGKLEQKAQPWSGNAVNIPAGRTITYGELAKRIGCRSAQAVGQALKRNPFAPEIPCHRVVAAGGSIGGYLGKREGEMIERKRKLLKNELCCIQFKTHNAQQE